MGDAEEEQSSHEGKWRHWSASDMRTVRRIMVIDKQSDLSNCIPLRFELRYLVFLSLYISSTYTSYFPGQKWLQSKHLFKQGHLKSQRLNGSDDRNPRNPRVHVYGVHSLTNER